MRSVLTLNLFLKTSFDTYRNILCAPQIPGFPNFKFLINYELHYNGNYGVIIKNNSAAFAWPLEWQL